MAKRKMSTKAKAKRAARRVGRKAKPMAKKAKRGAKRLGKKAARLAKSDPGRAGIGAGVGALALGPVGAVAGAAVGLATRGKKKNPMGVVPKVNMARQIFRMEKDLRHKDPEAAARLRKKHEEAFHFLERKVSTKTRIPRTHPMYAPITSLYSDLSRRSNPEPMIKVSSVMGSMLLDYHRASPAIESVSAASLRGEKVPLSHIEKARQDLHALKKLQRQEAERGQIEDLVEALDKLSRKAKRMHSSNPARAFSLDAQVKQIRQGKAKKGAMGMVSRSKIYGEVKSKSLASKLRKINPGSMLDELIDDYRRSKKRWIKLSTKSSSDSKQIERAQKRTEDAENRLILYADTSRLSPQDLRAYMSETSDRRASRNPHHTKKRGRPRKNPLEHIPQGAGIRKIRSVVSDNISTEMSAGKPQAQAVAIAISSAREDADRMGGATAKLIRSEYPRKNSGKRKRGRPRKNVR